jgi:hypothetical protein
VVVVAVAQPFKETELLEVPASSSFVTEFKE